MSQMSSHEAYLSRAEGAAVGAKDAYIEGEGKGKGKGKGRRDRRLTWPRGDLCGSQGVTGAPTSFAGPSCPLLHIQC